MKLKHYGMLVAGLGLLASCSNEAMEGPNQPETTDNGEGTYFTVNIVQNEGTRTTTPNSATKNAEGDEAKIKSATLIFADASNKVMFTAALEADGKAHEVTTNDALTCKFKVEGTNYTKLTGLTNNSVKIYAVCNGTVSYTEGDDIQKIMELTTDGDTYWGTNGFFMSSAKSLSKELNIDGIKNGIYNDKNPQPLGTIDVQRAMARLDVSKKQPTTIDLKNSGISVKFDGLSLVNLSKNFYLYKQVGGILFDPETASNWVDDPKKDVETYTDDHLFRRAVAKNAMSQSYDTWFNADVDYTKWNYVTPNTVSKKEDQVNGKSTGIIFRAEITGLGNLAEGEGPLYIWKGQVWGTETAISKSNDPTIKDTYVNLGENKAAGLADLNGMVVYPVTKVNDENKYYCYYYYWIRHNGVGTNHDGQMNTMEFGVVRNNVYQLGVTKVTGFGKPGTFTPDPTYPDDKLESEGPVSDTYFTVDLQVLPWGVRTDAIEF